MDYKKFKKNIEEKGHNCYKKGKYITIIPNNRDRGFLNAWDLIPMDYRINLKFLWMDNYNSHIYKARFKIKEGGY